MVRRGGHFHRKPIHWLADHTMQTLIRAGLLIDGTSGPPLKDAALLIEHGRIRAVGPAAEIVSLSSSVDRLVD